MIKKQVLVLSSADTDYTVAANQEFIDQIMKRLGESVVVDSMHYNDIALYISDSEIDAWKIDSSKSLRDYDLIYFKSYYRFREQATAIAHFCESRGVKYVCSEVGDGISFSKLTQYTKLSQHKLPIIETIFVDNTRWSHIGDVIGSKLGWPIVLKDASGRGGDLNYMLDSYDQLIDIVSQNPTIQFVAQKFVPNDYDMRVLVVGGGVELVIKRQRSDENTHLNNTSKGAGATIVPVGDINDKVKSLAIESAAVFKREIAGVDIMFDKIDGQPCILEVNASPQVATGAFTDEKLDVYAELFSKLLLTD